MYNSTYLLKIYKMHIYNIRFKTNHKCFQKSTHQKSIKSISFNEIFGDNICSLCYIFPINPMYKDQNIFYGYKLSTETFIGNKYPEFTAYL